MDSDDEPEGANMDESAEKDALLDSDDDDPEAATDSVLRMNDTL